MRRTLALFLLVLSLLSLNSCQAPFPYSDRGWIESDLRWLGGLDAPSPATDLLAVYTHTSGSTVRIRLDLLDINPGDPYQIKISLWDNRSFAQTPLRLDLASDGSLQVDNQGGPAIWPRVVRDFAMDTIDISMNRFLIGNRYHFDVTTYQPGAAAPADEAQNIHSDGLMPTQRAPFFVAFSDTFPVDTPAQTLRRWDGAHTGPFGNRNGLKYVLQAARQYHIPIALLDLKTPSSLAALNYLGELGLVRFLNQNSSLILPDAAWSQPADMALAFSQRAGRGFDLSASPFLYDPANQIPSGYAAKFTSLSDSAHLAVSGGMRLIPLPQGDTQQATVDGPSLDVRRSLVNAMLSNDPADLVVLGGSLTQTTWGQADMVDPTFQWLDGHYWLHRLNADDLLTLPAGKGNSIEAVSLPAPSPLLQELRSAPANPARDLAREMYLQLNEPATSTSFQTLRNNYLGEVNDLLAAARWAESPTAESTCTDEAESGGEARCILSNQSTFAILESNGARLTFLFQRDANGLHQIVGPSSQFAVGLSDPSEWKLDAGEAADPSVIPGAFADTSQPWMSYPPTITKTGISFTSADGQRTKAFRLTENGLEADYHLPAAETVSLLLAVDPLAYDFGPVDYRPAIGANTWTWAQVGGVEVEVSSNAHLSAQGFNASYPFLTMSEDPNLDYPRGHYLPFPLSLVTVQGVGNFKVEITVR